MIAYGAAMLALVLATGSSDVRGARARVVPQDTGRVLARPGQLNDLPLVLQPASGPASGGALAVLVTGDGGWAALDRGVAGVLSDAGMPVVGFNSLKYFWTRRTPEQAAADLERVLRYYQSATGRHEIVLVGYSLGADVLPFMVARLSPELRRQVRLLALLGPSRGTDFKFHMSDWWSNRSRDMDRPVLPEVTGLLGEIPVLCVYGAEDDNTICPQLPSERAEVVRLEGAHHFDGGYAELGRLVLRAAAPRAGA